MRSDLVDLALYLKHETDLAILVSDGKREAWLPKSAIEWERDRKGNGVTVTMPEHLAIDKGLV